MRVQQKLQNGGTSEILPTEDGTYVVAFHNGDHRNAIVIPQWELARLLAQIEELA